VGLNTIMLERQHETWQGVANPLVNDGSVTSPNVALSFMIEGDLQNVLANCPGSRKAKKLRSQMRKLEALGTVEIVIPVGARQAQSVLGQFFAFKADRFKNAGIPDVFADEGTRNAFSHMFAASASRDDKTHELHLLTVGGETAAIMGCTVHDGRMTVEFSTFNPAFSQAGPGDLLFFKAVEDACARGFRTFDFGIGDEPYKRSWCDIETWHKDTFIAISARGQLQKLAKTMRSDLVRRLKSNEPLWNAAKAARKRLAARA
jgi:CelD/BcsL family acetyltransferase involved in cellulose biosynthesis